jgi:HlyD family secretion protein
LAVGFAAGYQAYPWSHAPTGPGEARGRGQETQGATGATVRPQKVVALGRLEPRGGVIHLGAMTGDRLAKLEVHEGDQVKAGQELAYLESHALRQSELALAEAQLKDAEKRQRAEVSFGQAQVREAELAVKQLETQPLELRAQQARIESLEANLNMAQRDLERLQGLDAKLVSPKEREHQQLLVTRATEELEAARAQLDQLAATQEINRLLAAAKLQTAQAAIPRLEAAVQLESAKHNIALARARVEQAVLRAPSDGRILRINVQPGEMVAQRPIIEMADASQMYAVAEVYETDIRWVQPGQAAKVSSPALPTESSGTVERVGTVIARNTEVGLDPTRSADARVVEVMIRLDRSEAAAGLLHLQVDVEIDVSPSRLADAAR